MLPQKRPDSLSAQIGGPPTLKPETINRVEPDFSETSENPECVYTTAARTKGSMDTTNLTPSGWYSDPRSSEPGAVRWWDGTEWTDQTRSSLPVAAEQMTPAGQHPAAVQPGTTDAPLRTPINPKLRRANFILVALTTVLLLFNFGNALLGALECLCATAVIVIGIVYLVAWHSGRDVRLAPTILQLVIGICGATWFVWLAVETSLLFASQQH